MNQDIINTHNYSEAHLDPTEESRDIKQQAVKRNRKLWSRAGAQHHCGGITLRVKAHAEFVLRVTDSSIVHQHSENAFLEWSNLEETASKPQIQEIHHASIS